MKRIAIVNQRYGSEVMVGLNNLRRIKYRKINDLSETFDNVQWLKI